MSQCGLWSGLVCLSLLLHLLPTLGFCSLPGALANVSWKGQGFTQGSKHSV